MAMYFSTDIPSLTGLKKIILFLHRRQQKFIPNRINIVKLARDDLNACVLPLLKQNPRRALMANDIVDGLLLVLVPAL